jgi:hypothetical protein
VQTGFLQPLWRELVWTMKTCQHRPQDKLQDLLVSILAGQHAVYHINTHVRPDLTLARSWGRQRFAEQSTVADVLDSLSPEQVAQLRRGSQLLFQQHSRTTHHDYSRGYLLLDVDPTGLPAARRAQGSRKGYFAGKRNQYGRQLARVSVPTYHETLCSVLYPGNQAHSTLLKPSMHVVEDLLGPDRQQPHQTIVRIDAGLGTDANLNWLLWRDYQVLAKGFSASRARAFAGRLTDSAWIADPPRRRWIALAPKPPRFARRIRIFVLRWQAKQGLRHGSLLCTLPDLEPLSAWRLHDGRGAVEVEIKADKQGLRLPRRRKHSFPAQEALILLTDVAHNLLSWVHHWTLEETPFDDFGTQRMVDELLTIPGRIEFKGGRLHKVALLETHPYADPMRLILEKLLDHFDSP